MSKTQELFSNNFPNLNFKFDHPLASQTYFKIGGAAEVYLESDSKEDIANLVKFCQANSIKLTILGGASNVIVADEGIKGLVLKLNNDDFEKNSSTQKLIVGAGIKLPALVKQSIDERFTGLEYFHGVPGSLGGAIYNNAHYLDSLIGDHVARVEVIDKQGKISWLNKENCDFSYDHSRFQSSQEIIFSVEFDLEKGNSEKSQELIKEAVGYRAKTQPLNLPSSGCIFQNVKNTEKLKEQFPQFADHSHVPGGFLIDQAGLKGERVGDIEISSKHAAFFVNHGAGRASDVQRLVEIVKNTVKEKFGVDLQAEVFFIGNE